MARVLNAVGRRWMYRHQYNRYRDWLLSYYDSILRLFRSWPLPLRDRVIGFSLKASDRPLFVRMGHFDGFGLEEVFLRKVYHSHLNADLGNVRQIVDLGGNIGMTVRLWQLYFPDAEIVVVEPSSANWEVLQKNIEGATNVRAVMACIGARARQAYLAIDRSEGQFRLVDQPVSRTQDVPVITMTQLLQESGVSGHIDLLKCDIEGGEEELFSDCQDWIGKVRNITIEIHGDYTNNRLLEDLARNGAEFIIATQNDAENVLLLQRKS